MLLAALDVGEEQAVDLRLVGAGGIDVVEEDGVFDRMRADEALKLVIGAVGLDESALAGEGFGLVFQVEDLTEMLAVPAGLGIFEHPAGSLDQEQAAGAEGEAEEEDEGEEGFAEDGGSKARRAERAKEAERHCRPHGERARVVQCLRIRPGSAGRVWGRIGRAG